MAAERSDAEPTEAPLHVALGRLLERRGMTLAALAAILRAEGLTIGRTRLHQIAAGQGPPASAAHIERLASVLGVAPGHFAEYRLWRVRSLLDPGMVGFDRAMENLSRMNGRRQHLRVEPNGRTLEPAGSYTSPVSEVKERA